MEAARVSDTRVVHRPLHLLGYDSLRLLLGAGMATAAVSEGHITTVLNAGADKAVPMAVAATGLVLGLSGLLPMLKALFRSRPPELRGVVVRLGSVDDLDPRWGQPEAMERYESKEDEREPLPPTTVHRRWQRTGPPPPRSSGDWPNY